MSFCYNYTDMLKEILSGVLERQRQFLLLRMTGLDKQAAMLALGVPEGTYKVWVAQKRFQKVYRQIDELGSRYKEDAVLMLRERNYALAVNLEREMLGTILEEIRTGTPVFSRTHLGREIYHKLASEISTRPQITHVTWEELILQGQQQALPEGEVIDANYESTS